MMMIMMMPLTVNESPNIDTIEIRFQGYHISFSLGKSKLLAKEFILIVLYYNYLTGPFVCMSVCGYNLKNIHQIGVVSSHKV